MKGSLEKPVYYIYSIDKSGRKYNLKNVTTSLNISHGEKDLAAKASITIVNAKVDGIGTHLSSLVNLGDDIYIHADIGGGAQEVLRGIVWTKNYESDLKKEINLVVYDHLIFLQKSKDNFYFQAGMSTQDIVSTICGKWGVGLNYSYDSIVHPKLPIRSKGICDSIIEVLDAAKKQTGNKYVIYSAQNVLHIGHINQNQKVYSIRKLQNASSVKTEETMDGMVTKVVITGKENNENKSPVLATVAGDTGSYGTLQEVISKDTDTSLSETKKEADEILKEKGSPFKLKTVVGIDNPFIRKGDAVRIEGGTLNSTYTVLSIDHDAKSRTMIVEVE